MTKLNLSYRDFKDFALHPYRFGCHCIDKSLPIPDMTTDQINTMLLHRLIVTPSEVPAGFAVLDFPDRRTDAYKKAHAAALGSGLRPVLAKDVIGLAQHAESVRSVPLAQRALADGRNHSVAFTRVEGDVTFSASPPLSVSDDLFADPGAVILVQQVADLSTTVGTARHALWALKAAYCAWVGGQKDQFLVAVENSAPFSTMTIRFSPDNVKYIQGIVNKMTQLIKDGSWKAYRHLHPQYVNNPSIIPYTDAHPAQWGIFSGEN